MDYQKFIQAAQQLERAAAARRQVLSSSLEREVAEALGRNDREQAATLIEAFLKRQPGAARWWHELASIRQQQGDVDGAESAWHRALAAGMGELPLLHRIGQALAAAGHDPAGIAGQAWPAASQAPELRSACLAALRGDWAMAMPVLMRMMRDQPADQRSSRNLAFALEHTGRAGQAQCVRALHLLARGQAREALELFEAAPTADARSPEFIDNFLRTLRVAGEEERAITIAKSTAPEAIPRSAYLEWANALMDLGRCQEGIDVLRKGAASLGDASLALQAELILPAVPASQAALEQAHRRVRRNMLTLREAPLPETPQALDSLAQAMAPNFFLPYLGGACVEEARAYGQFAERVMRARFPQFSEPPATRQRGPGEPIRIGCATSFVNHHVVMKSFAGWLQRSDRGAFEIHLFPLATEHNEVTDYLAKLVDTFHPPTTSTEVAARQIRDAGLDLLAYPEIGMDPLSFRLAAMRLAPVQCVAGGHPMTTGLSTIDYYLSAAAAEPADAASHYTERLVTLPGMGICMPLPTPPAKGKTRADFGLPADSIAYLSTQSLFKYLPVHDELYARIAKSVENAVFVFVEGRFPAWTRTFAGRLRQSFTSRGLDPDRHLHFIPRQDYGSFLSLNAACDVFLDPPGGFSGGMTSRDALACGLPVVTLPGDLMRTRQSLGLLAELGIDDTVAADLDDYVQLAISLGRDRKRRAILSQRILQQRHVLFDDPRCADGLAAFLRWGAGAAREDDEALFSIWPNRTTAA